MAFGYGEVKDLYDTLKTAGVVTTSLPDWATEMNKLTQTDLYSAGLHDNLIKRSSHAIDKLLESSGLVDVGREFGRSVGETVGAPEAGARIGAGLPRSTFNFAPLLIPGVGVGATAARLGLTGLLSGAGTYTETGSPAAGLISGTTAAALPGVTNFAEQQLLKGIGGRLVEGPLADAAGQQIDRVSRYFPTTGVQKAASFLTGQGVAAGLMGAGGAAESVVQGETPQNPLSTENLLNLTLGQLPFAALHLATKGRVSPVDQLQHAIDISTKLIETRQAKDTLDARTPIEQIPDTAPVEATPDVAKVIEETNQRLSQLRGEQVKVNDDLTLTPEERVEKLNKLVAEEAEVTRTKAVTTGESLLGDTLTPATPRETVLGRQLRSTDKWRAVFVDDVPENPENLRGKIVSYSTAYEPTPTKHETGATRYALPSDQWRTVKTVDEWQKRGRSVDPQQPELPQQPREPTREELFGHIQDLQDAETEIDAAQTSAQVQSALTKVNDVKAQTGLPETNDASLRRRTKMVERSGLVPEDEVVKVAAKVEVRDAQRRLQALTQDEAARTSALMGQGGFSVIDESKLSHAKSDDIETKPISDVVTDTAFAAIATREGREAFAGWNGRDDTTINKDAQDFVDLVENYGSLKNVPLEEAGKLLAERSGTVPWTKREVQEFLDRPHVKVWSDALTRGLANIVAKAPISVIGFHGTTLPEFKQFAFSGDRSDLEYKGHHFTDSPETAAIYAKMPQTESEAISYEQNELLNKRIKRLVAEGKTEEEASRLARAEPGRIVRAKIDLENPKVVDLQGAKWDYNTYNQLAAEAKAEGHDGLVIKNVNDTNVENGPVGNTTIVFDEHAHKIQYLDEQLSRAPGGRGIPNVEEPFVPQTEEDQAMLDRMGVARGGQGLLDYLLKSEVPLIRGLADDLRKFPESLQRVTAQVMKTDGTSYARKNFNREVNITLNHGLLNTSDFVRDITIAHELVHGLTLAEVDNPAKANIVRGLSDMRERVVDALPKDMRKLYDDAVENRWHERYLENTASYDELGKDWKTRNILYALIDNDEFLSQGLTNSDFQGFLKGMKPEQKQGWFHRFSNFVKELLGVGERIKGTAFEEFLSRTDQLMQSGEYAAGFHNFAEGFYKNLGFSDVLAQGQTQRALGLVIDSPYGLTTSSIFESLDLPGVVRSREYITANRNFDRMQTDRGDDFIGHAKVMDELGFGVTKNGMDEFTRALLTGDVTQTDAVDLLPKASTDYLFAKVKDYRDVLSSIKAATSEKNKGLVNLADPRQLKPAVGEALNAINKVLKIESEHQQAERTIQELQAVAPDGYFDAMVGDVARAPVWMEDADRSRKGFGTWLKNFLQPVGQLARENPEAAEIVARGFQLPANQRKMVSEGLQPFGLDLDSLGTGNHVLSKESVKRMEQAMKNTRVAKAADDWIYLNQRKGKESDAVTLLPQNDPDVAKVLAKLTTKERADVDEVVQKHQISQQVMQSQTLEKMLQISSTNGAIVAGRSTGLKVSQNITLTDALLRALTIDRADPTAAQQADAQIALVQSKMTPEGFLDLLKFSQGEAEKWKLWQTFFQKNPAWSSGQRYGKFLVEYVRGNRTFLKGVESRKEAEAVAEGGRITKFEKNQQAEEDRPPVLGPDSLGMITRLRELETNQQDMLRSSLSPDELQQLRDTSPVEQFATEEAYRGGVPNLRPPPRGLTKGAEELPWLSNHFSWVNKTATYWSRQLLRAQARAHLLEPEIAQNEALQNKLKTHFDNILHPDPEFAQRMNKLVTTWFMGYNPASAIINATQPFLTHVAEMTSLSGKPIESYRRTLAALDEVKSAVGNRGWKTKEHEWLMSGAAEDGERSFSMFDEQSAAQETIDTNYKRLLAGNRTQTTGQRLGTLSGAYSTAGMWMFKGVEKINNEAALLSSFDYYREQGLSKEEARDKAYEFNHSVNYGGGRAQRPVGVFSGRGTFPRSAAMLATSMQSYVLGTTFQLTRYIERGFFRPVGITPHEVYAARKAAVQMLGTQLVAAGTLGLPFVSGALALLNATFPDLELNRRAREIAAGLFSSDKENGNLLGDIAMTGVPSMFGWDLQSRLSMGNTVPGVSEVNGFQPELLLGAPANLVSTFVKGGQQIASGNVSNGIESFVPSALKKITQLISTGGQVKDYRDRPLFQPSVGEGLGIALGFQPKRLSDFNVASRIAKQTEDVATRRTGQFHQQQAEEVLKGNFGNVRQQLLSRSQDDKSYNPIEGVRAVARAAEELTFPRDLRREGSQSASSARSQLLSAFRIDPQQPSETDRLKFRTEVQRRLGLPTGPSAGDQQIAFLMDSLRRQQPEATRVELRQAAEHLVRRQRFQTLQEPTE